MLRFLFPTLTEPHPGADLFDAATAEARRRHWYIEGAVPDTLDGRFAMLATVTALVLVALDALGEEGNAASVGLTERFVEAMDSEHRQLGLGDPALGKQVRKLVGSLARRVELWRSAIAGARLWREATRESVYRSPVAADALDHSTAALEQLWGMLRAEPSRLRQGRIR